MLVGLLDWPMWGILGYLLIMTHITIISITIYLHRHQTHHALSLHSIVSHFFRFWLWCTTGMLTKEWVAVHRKHHAHVETQDDPHSPQRVGIRKLLLEGTELYQAAARDKAMLEKYGFGTPDDWIERKLYTPHSRVGIVILLVVNLLLFGVLGLTVWAIHMLWAPFLATGIINGIGHYWGYRNFELTDASRNVLPWGILIGGEELHNNHHTHASAARFSFKWWEVDIGWCYIRVLSILGLARIKKLPPKPIVLSPMARVDIETVKDVISYRFQIMARYGREVLHRVHRDELRFNSNTERSLLRRARGLLIREESLLDAKARQHLQDIFNQSNALKTVYDYKQKLQEIWKHTAATHEHLLQAIQDWCHQAEKTGITALQDFAQRLRDYSLCMALAHKEQMC